MVTLKDIAEKAGVSVAAVSRVLSQDKTFSISNDTRQLILEIAQELQYQGCARNAKRPWRFALLILHTALDEIEDPYYINIRVNVRREAALYDIPVDEIFVGTTPLSAAQLTGYSALIVLGSTHTWSREIARCVEKSGKLVAIADFWTDDLRYDCIYLDFRDLVKLALKHLEAAGYQRIGYLGGRERSVETGKLMADLRERYFEESMRLSGNFQPQYVLTGEETTCNMGYQLAKEAIQKNCLPEAYFVSNDSMAIGALRAFREAGISVPEQVALVGCNDIPAAAYLSPPLTTVRLRADMIGIMAVRLLRDRLLHERDMGVHVVVPSELVVRESSGKKDVLEVAEREKAD